MHQNFPEFSQIPKTPKLALHATLRLQYHHRTKVEKVLYTILYNIIVNSKEL